MNRDRKKRGRKYKIEDFIPKWGDAGAKRKTATTPESMMALAEEFTKVAEARAGHPGHTQEGTDESIILDARGNPVRKD